MRPIRRPDRGSWTGNGSFQLRAASVAAVDCCTARGTARTPCRSAAEHPITARTICSRGACIVATGTYTVQATLIHDLNRYNDRAFTDDQTEMGRTSLSIVIP